MPILGQKTKGRSAQIISIGELDIHLCRKRVKNINLRISRDGQVMVSAPRRVPLSYIDEFIRSKSTWIHQCRKEALERLKNIPPSSTFEVDSLHYLWGRRYPIKHQPGGKLKIEFKNDVFWLSLPEQTPDETEIQKCIDNWYRSEIKSVIPQLLTKWQAVVGAEANEWGVKKMRTKWGTCNIQAARIWLNLELIKYPSSCLEYVVVHELTHLHERYHNKRFYSIVARCLPNWREQEQILESFIGSPDTV